MQDREEEPLCLVQVAGRPAGSKEMRYAHTFCPVPELAESDESAAAASTPAVPGTRDRLNQLEERLQEAMSRIEKLETLMNEFTS